MKVNNKYLYFFTALLCLFSIEIFAQIPFTPASIQSPNAASLGMYGKIPVSYFTGIPQIQIPLYQLKQNNLEVPITLSYHASGVRPDAHPGWVGNGFSLMSGGVISRVIKNIADEWHYPNSVYDRYRGYYYNESHSKLNTSNWNQTDYMKTITRAQGNDIKDTEPDEFSFNFDGYSGSFYMNADGNWKVKCDKPLRIKKDATTLIDPPFTTPNYTAMYVHGMSKTFGGFVIITENGTEYQFGMNTNAIEFGISFFQQHVNQWFANSWFLTKITAPNGEVIDFTYERDNFINQMYIGINNTIKMRAKDTGNWFDVGGSCASLGTFYHTHESYGGELIAPVYLKQISGLHTNIKFERSTSTELPYGEEIYEFKHDSWYNDSSFDHALYKFLPILTDDGTAYPACLNKLQWKQLDQIRIEKKNGDLLKAFNFDYTNNSNERLTLKSVQELDENLDTIPAYHFKYIAGALPGYLSDQVDHWGFYNATTPLLSNININTYYTTYYNYRQPKEAYLFAGTLNKITYPTGGVTEFTYEPHRYSKRLKEIRGEGIDNSFNENTLAGGLRIKKIVSYDPADPTKKQEKRYFYVNGFSNVNGLDINNLESSGILGGRIKYYFENYTLDSYNDHLTYSLSTFSSQSVIPGSINAQGSHVGYSKVVEQLSDGSYTIFSYTNFGDHNDAGPDNIIQTETPYEPYSSQEQERGNLEKEESYNSTNVLVKRRNISYSALNKTNEYVPSLKAKSYPVCNASYVEEATAYRFYTYSYLPAVETTDEYDKSGSELIRSTTKSYIYDTNYKLLKSEKFTDSRNREIKTDYTYPTDFESSPNTVIENQMFSKHIFSPVISQTTYLNNSQIAQLNTNYSYISSNYVPTSVITKTSASSSPVTKAIAEYDNIGNPIHVRKNLADLGTCYLWGYGGQFLIAKIENVDLTSVISLLGGQTAINIFRDLLEPSATEINTFLSPLNTLGNVHVTSYTFDPHKGLSSSTDMRGKTTYYDYDPKLRLKSIRDFNGDILKYFQYNYRSN